MRKLHLLIALFISIDAYGAESARARMEAFSKGLDAVTAAFSQQVFDASDKPKDPTRGTLALKAPRQFRWETLTPYKQSIVADGDHVWIYDPDLEQVSVRNQSQEEAHSPLTVLTDLSQIDREFTASEQGEHDGMLWLRLKPKEKEAAFEYADLGFDAQQLKRMQFKDTLGNRTEIRFENWQRNPILAVGEFKFTPPKGVDVIGDVKPGADVFPIKD